MDSRSILAPASVIAALRAALDGNPEDVPLRLHLGAMLLTAGDHAGSMEQFAEVLARDPAHLDALRGAAEAAEGLGQTLRAGAYRRLYQALAAGTALNCSPLPPPPAEEEQPRMPRFFDPAEVLGEPARIPVTRAGAAAREAGARVGGGPDDEEF